MEAGRAAALLLGVDPKSLNSEAPDGGDESLSQKLADIRELIKRAYKMNDLQNHTRPNVILEWARHKGFDIPEGFLEAVRRYGGCTGLDTAPDTVFQNAEERTLAAHI